jgi:hypothetical protein
MERRLERNFVKLSLMLFKILYFLPLNPFQITLGTRWIYEQELLQEKYIQPARKICGNIEILNIHKRSKIL